MDPLNQKIAEQLKRVRRHMGVSQRAACEQVFGTELHQGLWSRWERGVVRPNLSTLEKIADWAGVSVDSFGVRGMAPGPSEHDIEQARRLLEEALHLLGGGKGR